MRAAASRSIWPRWPGDCITDLRARAHEAGVEVARRPAAGVDAGEPALLERLVANLLDNAIRHNVPGGFVDVSTRHR